VHNLIAKWLSKELHSAANASGVLSVVEYQRSLVVSMDDFLFFVVILAEQCASTMEQSAGLWIWLLS
jgi:hypothetical protein